HHDRLARLGRRDDQRTLALALRRHQVEDAAGDVLAGAVAALELALLAREQRRQVLEQHLVLRRFQRLAIDGVDHVEREVALAVLRPADAAGEVVAGAQVETADLAGRDVGIVRAGQVAGLGGPQEAEPVGQDLQHAVGGHAFTVAGEHLQYREDDVLLAGTGDPFGDVQLLGNLQQLVRRHALEVAQRIGREAFGHLRVGARNERLVAAVIARQAVARTALATATAATATATAALALVAETFAAVIAASAVGVARLAVAPGLAIALWAR